MATESENNTPLSTGKKRKTKDLPECLMYLTEKNVRTMVKARLETNPKETGGEVMVAYAVMLQHDDESTFDLNSLTLDQIRKLCKNVGVQYVNKCTKFQCRKALWILSRYQLDRENDSRSLVSASEKTTNNIVRITNILFSHEFFESFMELNDIKTREDHEAHAMPKLSA
jgi:hypothetical protein